MPDSVVIDALKGIQGVGIFHLLFVCHDCGQHPFLMLLLHVAALSHGQRGKSAIWLGIQLPNDIFCGCPVALEASASLLSFRRLALSSSRPPRALCVDRQGLVWPSWKKHLLITSCLGVHLHAIFDDLQAKISLEHLMGRLLQHVT